MSTVQDQRLHYRSVDHSLSYYFILLFKELSNLKIHVILQINGTGTAKDLTHIIISNMVISIEI